MAEQLLIHYNSFRMIKTFLNSCCVKDIQQDLTVADKLTKASFILSPLPSSQQVFFVELISGKNMTRKWENGFRNF